MIVSWDWLKDYVSLNMSVEELTDRLTMTGLNLEGIEQIGDDTAIDLEVTSNRPDCLGHIGVAREIGVIFEQPLNVPEPAPKTNGKSTADITSVTIACEDLCPHYYARVIKGVKVGPSPEWLQYRLQSLGIACVNNVVDITNYVLMECGQPLHAFDFNKLAGQKIIVRRANANEKLTAIDQKLYQLDPEMCVIADAEQPVAIAGVMGGLSTEISEETTDVLIEVAAFAPVSVRTTARKLSLHSDSSYRFERSVDVMQLDWASRRCCELILEMAGGELLKGAVKAGVDLPGNRQPISIRYDQVDRLLGIEVPPEESNSILQSLGLKCLEQNSNGCDQFVPPSWRKDLEREVDLIEEVARIHGYDQIPDDDALPVVSTAKSKDERVSDLVRNVLTAAGFFETITLSFVSDESIKLFNPRESETILNVEHSSRRQESNLRQSLIPSLLACRRENEKQGSFDARLFEIAKVYLQARPGFDEQQTEPTMISCVAGAPYREMKGLIETLVELLNPTAVVTAQPAELTGFVNGRGAQLFLNDQPLGWLGELDRAVTDQLDLRDEATAAELDYKTLLDSAELIAHANPLPSFPAITRDINFVLAENTSWDQLRETIESAAGPLLVQVRFLSQYRGQHIAADKKSYVTSLSYRAADRTLTSEEVDQIQVQVVAACARELSAEQR